MKLSDESAEFGLARLVAQGAESTHTLAREEARAWIDGLERHGVLGYAARDRESFDASLDEEARAWAAERLAAGEADARRDRATLRTLLEAWRRAGVEVLLLKGASLAFDVFPDGAERRMGDLDLLVSPGAVRAALDSARPLGLVPPSSSMPLFWYRWTHFHAKLAPATALQREVEVHWALHHDAALYTIDSARLFADRREVEHPELGRAWTLSETDRFLHACTHLASHALGGGAPLTRTELHELLGEERPLVRFKWLVDLHALARRPGRPEVEHVLERAAAWGALAAVSFAVHSALALGEEPWLRELAEGLPRTSGARPTLRAAPPTGALDFRIERLGEWGRWFLPPVEYLERRRRVFRLGWGARALHAAEVVGRTLRAMAAFVPACIGRVLLRASREKARRVLSPERVLDLAAGWRQR